MEESTVSIYRSRMRPMYSTEGSLALSRCDHDDHSQEYQRLIHFLIDCTDARCLVFSFTPAKITWLVTDEFEYEKIGERYGLSKDDFIVKG